MARPNVNITLGNGNLGRSAATDDGVAALLLTGATVSGKLELNKHYQLSGTADLVALGVTADNNPLVYKEVTAFYEQTGDGAELHLLVVAEATTPHADVRQCGGFSASQTNRRLRRPCPPGGG